MLFVALVLLAVLTAFRGSSVSAQDNGPQNGVITAPDAVPAPLGGAPLPPVMGQAFLSFGAEAFNPWNPASTWDRNSSLMIRPLTPAGSNQALDAALTLPNGVTVKQIVAYIVDNDAANNVSLLFVPHAHTNASALILSQAASSGASPDIRFIALDTFHNENTLDYTQNSYFVRVQLIGGANTYLNTIRVDYSYPVSLPSIRNQ
jgi:hypothetical protein